MANIIQNNKEKLDLFVQDSIDLAGKYPDVPPEVYDVFYGMINGKIEKTDLHAELSVNIGTKVYDTWFSSYPVYYRDLLRLYCMGYLALKSENIHDIIGDTTIFELPSINTPNLDTPQFLLQKDKLDAIFEDLRDQLSELWPDDDVSKDDGKAEEDHLSQISDMEELEKELLLVTQFINNPQGPMNEFSSGLEENYNSTLERIGNLKNSLGEFWDKLKEAGTRLQNLDLPSMAELNDSVFLEMTNEMEQSITSTCEAMINTFESRAQGAEYSEKFRLYVLIGSLTYLKENPTQMKDYVANAIRKKDIEALNVSVNNQKYIEELSKISIEYQQNKLMIEDFSLIGLGKAVLSYNLYQTQIEGQRVCDCIRVFNKMKSVNNGLNDIFMQACVDYTKSFFPTMTASEKSMFANGVAKGVSTNSKTLNVFGLDRLTSIASDISTETKSIIDKTKASEATIINH